MIQVSKLAHLKGHKGPVYTIEKGLEPDAFFSAGADGVLVQWQLNSEIGKALATFPTAVFVLKNIQLTDGRNLLLAGGKNGILYIFDLNTLILLKAVQHHQTAVFSICRFSNNIYTGDESGIICCWNENFELIKSVKIAEKSIRSIVALDHKLAAGVSDSRIIFLDSDLMELENLTGHTNSVFSLAYSGVQKTLFSAGRDAQIIKWDLERASEPFKINAHMYPIHSIALNPSNKLLASGSMDKAIRLWEAETLNLMKVIDAAKFEAHASSVNQVLWLNEHTLASCSDDRTVQVFKMEES